MDNVTDFPNGGFPFPFPPEGDGRSILRNLIGSLDLRQKIISKLSVTNTSLCSFAFIFCIFGLDRELSFLASSYNGRCRSTHRYVGLQACSLCLVSETEIRNLS